MSDENTAPAEELEPEVSQPIVLPEEEERRRLRGGRGGREETPSQNEGAPHSVEPDEGEGA